LVFDADGEKYDMTFSEPAIDVQRDILQEVYGVRPSICDAIYEPMLQFRGNILRNGTRVQAHAQLNSGHPGTYVVNSIRNASETTFVINTPFRHIDPQRCDPCSALTEWYSPEAALSGFGGDDSLALIVYYVPISINTKEFVNSARTAFTKGYTDLGTIAKVNITTDLWRASIFSSYFVPCTVNAVESYALVPKQFRQLNKIFSCHNDSVEVRRTHAAQVATNWAALADIMLIVGPVIQRVLALVPERVAPKHDIHNFSYEMFPLFPDERTYRWFELMYGWDSSVRARWRTLVDSIRCPITAIDFDPLDACREAEE
jgi:hypothetical protein